MSRKFYFDYDAFHRFMQEPENIRPLLEGLLETSITKITPAPTHQILGAHVHAFTRDGLTYDISLQLVEEYDLGKRLRASQAIMDRDFLNPDNLEDETLKSCIIFICTDDPLGGGKAVRRIGRVISTLGNTPFDDGSSAFILNMSFTEANAAPDVCDFLRWVNAGGTSEGCGVASSLYLAQLDKAVPEIHEK
ncbi:hypothetical protein [Acutalibacter intestini]|uniref:hypothetical protein n=1 Tax=Acutalibacter intestini TaxID=3093659 RepID=UPI002AC98556|nr:hypothetical protein [Acutalibacter sp. M00204]